MTERIPHQAKVDGVLWAIIVFGWLTAFAGGLLAHAPTLTRTVRVPPKAALSHMTAEQIIAALGKPDQTVDGAQVSSGLAGATCMVWQSRHLLICH